MNSKYDMKSLMELNKEPLKEAAETLPMVVVQEQNWTAVLKVLSSICQSQDEIKEELGEMMKTKQVNEFLSEQQEMFEHRRQESQQAREQIQTMMQNTSSELLKQVGSMSAEYSSKLKEQENWRQKVSSRLFKILIASQALQLILWAMLLRWLR